jgi:hypothetical protein
MRAVADATADLEAPCAEIGDNLRQAINALAEATDWLIENGGKTPALAFAGATAYLELFGNVAGGAMMTRAACAAWAGLESGDGNQDFYKTKLATTRFYAEHVLPKCQGLAASITKGADSFLSLPEDAF